MGTYIGDRQKGRGEAWKSSSDCDVTQGGYIGHKVTGEGKNGEREKIKINIHKSQEQKNYSVHLGSSKNVALLKICLGYWFLLLFNLDQKYQLKFLFSKAISWV